MSIWLKRSIVALVVVMLCHGPGAQLAAQVPATAAPPQWVAAAVNAPRLQHRTFGSKAAGAQVSFHIYTPAVYDKEPSRRFPVMYWLHGSTPWLPSGLVKQVDARIEAGTLPPFLIVFPNGLVNPMWLDTKDGRVPLETIVIKELLPHVDATFRTIASPDGRLVEGESGGGQGAARLGFKYPELFGAVSILSGGPLQQVFDVNTAPRATPAGAQAVFDAIWGGDQEYYRAQSAWALAERNAEAIRRMRAIRMIVGDKDNVLENNRKFDAHLTGLKIPHTFTVVPGAGHGELAKIASALGDEFFAFYGRVFSSPGPAPRSSR